MVSFRESQVLGLLGQIYDAAAEPELWSIFLESLAERLQVGCTILAVHNADTGRAVVDSFVRVEPAEIARYERYYSSVNPWIAPGNAAHEQWVRSGEVGRADEVVPLADLRKTEFYADWSKRNGVVHMIGATLALDNSTICYVASSRSEQLGPHPESNAALLEVLIPHLKRALGLHEQLARLKASRQAVENIPAPVFLVTPEARVLEMNDPARRILAARDAFRLTADSRLKLLSREAQRSLEVELRRAASPARPGEETTRGSIRVQRLSERSAYLLTIVPLAISTRLLPSHRSKPILLFIDDPAQSGNAALVRAVRLYRLSKAESRVAGMLVEGHTLPEVAGLLRVSLNTIKTQVASVLRKTGTNRRAELIRVLLQSE